MPHITEAAVVEAVQIGIKKSHESFFSGTGGMYISHGPEYVITTHILQQLWERDIVAVPEHNLRDLMTASGTKSRGKFKNIISAGARCDIAVFSRSSEPICAIEVKRHAYNTKSLKADFSRLEELIVPKSGYSSFRYAISAFYIARDTTRTGVGLDNGLVKVERRLEHLKKTAESHCGNIKIAMRNTEIKVQSWDNIWGDDEGESAWAAACLLLKPKRERIKS